MLENSLKDNGCKARDRRNTWCIARLSNVADAAFGQYRAIQNANAASETRDRLREAQAILGGLPSIFSTLIMCRGRRSDALGLSRELCGDAPVELDSAGDFSDTL